MPMYPRHVRLIPRQQSPTTGLLFGLIIIVAAVGAYSWYITLQVSSLRQLQRDLVDRNRKDSLQLLRIQNDLNSAALAMRDMVIDWPSGQTEEYKNLTVGRMYDCVESKGITPLTRF